MKKITLCGIIALLLCISAPTVFASGGWHHWRYHKSLCDFPFEFNGGLVVRYDQRIFDEAYFDGQYPNGGIKFEFWLGEFDSEEARNALVDRIKKIVFINKDSDSTYILTEAILYNFLGSPTGEYNLFLGSSFMSRGNWKVKAFLRGGTGFRGGVYTANFEITQDMLDAIRPEPAGDIQVSETRPPWVAPWPGSPPAFYVSAGIPQPARVWTLPPPPPPPPPTPAPPWPPRIGNPVCKPDCCPDCPDSSICEVTVDCQDYRLRIVDENDNFLFDTRPLAPPFGASPEIIDFYNETATFWVPAQFINTRARIEARIYGQIWPVLLIWNYATGESTCLNMEEPGFGMARSVIWFETTPLMFPE